MHLHAVLTQVEGDVGSVKEVVGEVLLDDVALVTAANYKVCDVVGGVNLADVPEQGSTTDFDHGFGAKCRLLR
jgi:hypothetical protein